MMKPWVSARDLDKLNKIFWSLGFESSRHAYSYRLLYKRALVASVHVYPGYNEVSVRLYKMFRDIASEAHDKILYAIKQVFPNYKINVSWYPP